MKQGRDKYSVLADRQTGTNPIERIVKQPPIR
jgi:hypothetical protein